MSTPDAEPAILILDDLEIQRDAVQLQLHGYGRFVHFGDPRPALDYLRTNHVDAIIADIRMPSLPVDGLWFLEQFRQFDQDTAVIVRTGDEHIGIAEAAIEAHAIQRVIKTRPDATIKLRTAVLKAINDTRDRRKLLTTAAAADRSHHQLIETLARIDTDLTSTAITRALMADIVNHATALAGYADALAEPLTKHPTLRTIAAKNRTEAARLADKINDFLSNPFVDTRFAANSAASINPVITALDHYFREHPLLLDRQLRYNARGILPDLFFTANPPKLLTALRHLIEYIALHTATGTTIQLSVTSAPNAAHTIKHALQGFTLNARHAPAAPAAVITISAQCEYLTLPIADDLGRCSEDPRTGNLLIVSGALLDDRLVLTATPQGAKLTAFALYLPVSE